MHQARARRKVNRTASTTASHTAVLWGANAASTALSLIRGFLVARVLAPADYGTWNLLSTAMNYANYVDLGVNTGAILEAPTLIGRGQPEKASFVLRQGLSGALVITAGFACLLVLLTLGPFSFLNSAYARLVAISAVLAALLNFYQVGVRIQGRFALIALSNVSLSALGLAAIGVVVARGADDLVSSIALASLMGPLSAAAILRFPKRPARASVDWRSVPIMPFDWKSVRRLVVIGLPVSLVPIAFTLFQTVDRWVVAALVPPVEFGYYGLGSTIGGFLYTLPNSLAFVLYTKQIERFGSTGQPNASRHLVVGPLRFSSFAMAFAAGASLVFVPFLIRHVVPAYEPGESAAMLQIAGNCLLFAVPVGSNFLLSLGKQRHLFATLLLATGAQALLVMFMLRTPLNLAGAAAAVAVCDVLYGAAVTLLAMRQLGETLPNQLRYVALSFAPFAAALPASFALAAGEHLTGSLPSDVATLLIREALFCGPYLSFCCIIAPAAGWWAIPGAVVHRLPLLGQITRRAR